MKLGKKARQEKVLERVKCPVLVVQSAGDEAASPKAAREAYNLMGAEEKDLVWLTRSNHIVLWDYDRERAKHCIERFLMKTGGE